MPFSGKQILRKKNILQSSMKDFKAPREAFQSPGRMFSSSNNEIYKFFFFFFVGLFTFLDLDLQTHN
jgi:hypothetical protein